MKNLRGFLLFATLIGALTTLATAQSSKPAMMFGDTTHRKPGFAKEPTRGPLWQGLPDVLLRATLQRFERNRSLGYWYCAQY
ncbi:hypothetical protein [Spirosoma foliorum]|uniref:hypothetical protein n=1 Tax=Spirosoma foliorum TaxID=2710596 RepID=UPI001F0ABE1C|nr:hypothetical protein [Spirosoma foliorum]